MHHVFTNTQFINTHFYNAQSLDNHPTFPKYQKYGMNFIRYLKKIYILLNAPYLQQPHFSNAQFLDNHPTFPKTKNIGLIFDKVREDGVCGVG